MIWLPECVATLYVSNHENKTLNLLVRDLENFKINLKVFENKLFLLLSDKNLSQI